MRHISSCSTLVSSKSDISQLGASRKSSRAMKSDARGDGRGCQRHCQHTAYRLAARRRAGGTGTFCYEQHRLRHRARGDAHAQHCTACVRVDPHRRALSQRRSRAPRSRLCRQTYNRQTPRRLSTTRTTRPPTHMSNYSYGSSINSATHGYAPSMTQAYAPQPMPNSVSPAPGGGSYYIRGGQATMSPPRSPETSQTWR